MKVKITLVEEALGTGCANAKVHEEYIASKSADAAKVAEELGALPQDELMEKAVTVFPRDENGKPFIWDYQFKGFLKDAVGLLLELREEQGKPEIKVGKTRLSKFTFKRLVDNYVFVYPRKIALAGELGSVTRSFPLDVMSEICTRPIRVETMRGERVSLVSSETVRAGTTFVLEIESLSPSLDGLLRECLDYGAKKGLGQWRNSGKGRFTWEEIKG